MLARLLSLLTPSVTERPRLFLTLRKGRFHTGRFGSRRLCPNPSPCLRPRRPRIPSAAPSQPRRSSLARQKNPPKRSHASPNPYRGSGWRATAPPFTPRQFPPPTTRAARRLAETARPGASMNNHQQLTGRTGAPCAVKSATTRTPKVPGSASIAGQSCRGRRIRNRLRRPRGNQPDLRPRATSPVGSHPRSARTCAGCVTEPSASAHASVRPRPHRDPVGAFSESPSWFGVSSPSCSSRSSTRCPRCNSAKPAGRARPSKPKPRSSRLPIDAL